METRLKQPKLSKAEQFLIISFSLHSSCLILPKKCQSCYSLAGMDALRANKK